MEHDYAGEGETLYCEKRFKNGGSVERKKHKLSIEHAYPADWIAEAFGCENRDTCRNKTYKHAEGDLHNLWPALGRINSSRQDLSFGELEGETQRRFTLICKDFERSYGDKAIVEPRDEVKGDLARSVFYMMDSYCMTPKSNLSPMAVLSEWHELDPPDAHEKWRNDQIEIIQGTRNHWIDEPDQGREPIYKQRLVHTEEVDGMFIDTPVGGTILRVSLADSCSN